MSPRMDEKDLWTRYRRTRADGLRNQLVERYLYVVGYQVQKTAERTPHNVTAEDLWSAGVIGLMEAVRRFDPARGVKFTSYCVGRIRGAMLDYLRGLDAVPRLTRARANRLDKVREDLERKLERPPSDGELAKALRLSTPNLDGLMNETRTARAPTAPRRSLDRDPSLLPLEVIEDRRAETPFSKARRLDLFGAAMSCLPVRDCCAMAMYYVEGMTLKEIGWALGISESRACQIAENARVKMRRRLKASA